MRDRNGFTIAELVMTAIVVGIMAVATIAAISNVMRGIQLASAADKLASDLRYAQTMATGAGVWYGVSFEVDPVNRYRVVTTVGTVDTVVDNPAKRGTSFEVYVKANFNVTIAAATIDGGKKIEFSPLGTPYTDKFGSAITAEAVVTLRSGSSNRTVRITPNTGRIYLQ